MSVGHVSLTFNSLAITTRGRTIYSKETPVEAAIVIVVVVATVQVVLVVVVMKVVTQT